MPTRIMLYSLTCTLAFAIPGFGQVKLERRYTEGGKYKTETTSQTEQKLTIGGMETDTSSDTRTVSIGTVGKRDSAGLLRIQESVESLQTSITAQGSQYTFDSNNPDQKGSSVLEFLRDVHKAMTRLTTTYIVDKDNRIQGIELDQNFLGTLPEEVQKLVKSQLEPEHLKQVANQENERLPTDAVKKGDTWLRTENANFGAGQQMTFQTEYTYQGTIDKQGKTYDRITSKVLAVTFALHNSPLPLTLKGSDLKATESSGEILFDRSRGSVVSATTSTRIMGDIAFALNEKDLPSKLDLKISTTVTTSH